MDAHSATTFKSKILDELKRKYRFRKISGKWLQEGQCPDCNEWELYAAAEDPKVVTCGRSNNCGYQASVRDVLSDLFEDWSERFKPTPEDPNATADAYLRGRGLDLTGLRGHFFQENYFDRERNAGTATVRFPLPGGSWWERLIDRPGRFDKKARFKYGGSWAGHCWAHPDDGFDQLATMDEIWIAEGIFDCLALRQNFQRLEKGGRKTRATAVSAMTVNVWPEHFLGALRQAIAASKDPKHRPKLVFAFDVGAAGVKFTRKFVDQAQREGWDAAAAQVRPDGEGTKLDWNDLWLRQQDHKGDEGKGPLSAESLDDYLWNGDITCAKTAQQKARLIYKRKALASFDFRFENRLYFARSKPDEDGGSELIVDEVANCAFRVLYRERDDATDETNYFLEIAFPNAIPTAKARFSASCCATSGEFKKRLFAFGGIWAGSQEQLDRLMRGQTRYLKTVEPIHFTGYSQAHDAWVLGDLAVRDGRVIKIGSEKYFDFGKSGVKLRTEERLLNIDWNPDAVDLSWIRDVWLAWGERGVISLAYFTMSLFAVQIRWKQGSLGFLEIYGEPGSGKSTMTEFLWHLLGRPKHEGFDPNKATNAGIARNFLKVSGLPIGLIESGRDQDRQSHQGKFDMTELLTLFNGRSPRVLGVKSGGTETFEPPFLGTVYLMQNNPIDAMPAVLERIMSLRIDKKNWGPDSQPAARRLHQIDRAVASRWIVHVTRKASSWLTCYFDRFAHHEEAMPARVFEATKATLTNDRIILCHSQLAAAVDTLRDLFPKSVLPDEWIDKAIQAVDRMALERQQASATEHPVVEKFWGIFDYLCAIEQDDPQYPVNLHRSSTDLIAVNMPRFMEACRARGQQPPTEDELRKHLKGSKGRKYIGQRTVNSPSGKGFHCWVFQRPLSEQTII